MKAKDASKVKVYGNYIFINTVETYLATGRNFRKKPDTVEVKAITTEMYNNQMTWCNFFSRCGTIRISEYYTMAGNIPVRITRVAPDRSQKITDRYEVRRFPEYRKLGYREREILDNLLDVHLAENSEEHQVVTFEAEIAGEKRTFDYDYKTGKVTG